MANGINNDLLARVLFSHQLASREQILACWPYIQPQNDIGQLLVVQGSLDQITYFKVASYVLELQSEERRRESGLSQNSVRSGKESIQSDKPIENKALAWETEETPPSLEPKKGQLREKDPKLDDWSFPQQFDAPLAKKTLEDVESGFQPLEEGEEIDWNWAGNEDDSMNNSSLGSGKASAEKEELTDAYNETNNLQDPSPPQAAGIFHEITPIENISGFTNQPSLVLAENPPTAGQAMPEESSASLPSQFEGQPGWGELRLNIPNAAQAELSLDEILLYARYCGASDLHLCVGKPIQMRLSGVLQAADNTLLSEAHVQRYVSESLSFAGTLGKAFHDYEWIHSIDGGGRFRMTIMRHQSGWDMTARIIPVAIPSMADIGLPEPCLELTRWKQGLVLITGPAGSGKTTSLSTLIEILNQTRAEHIISIEEPIEVVYQPAQSQISQRQVSLHTLSQAAALKAALREDPDILVVGELRDPETIQLAVTAAETGHLVFGTMNTNNASRTIYRLIESFAPEEQSTIRNMISESLRGVIAQQLIPKLDGSGMVAAFEVLLINPAVANLIRKEELHQLGSAMITGKSSGMVLLDDSLKWLISQGLISGQEAYYRAINPKEFERYLGRK